MPRATSTAGRHRPAISGETHFSPGAPNTMPRTIYVATRGMRRVLNRASAVAALTSNAMPKAKKGLIAAGTAGKKSNVWGKQTPQS